MRVQRAIVWELATKELRLFFGSPLAYLVIGAFLGAHAVHVFLGGSILCS